MQRLKIFLLFLWLLTGESQSLFAQFQQTSGPEGGVINALTNHNGTLLAGSQGSGIFRSTDGGNSWSLSNTGLQSLLVFAFTEKDSLILAGTSSGVYRSTDDGLSWSFSGLTAGTVSLAIYNGYIFAGTSYSGIYRTNLNGSSWVQKNSGLTNLDVTSIVCCDTTLYIGTESGIFKSDVWGDNWTNAGFANFVMSLAVRQSMIFAGTGGGGIYKTVNGSSNWSYSGNGLAWGETITCITVNDSVIYAGSAKNGAYRSVDNGSTWTLFNSGLTDNYVRSLECIGANPIAGTNGGGAFLYDETAKLWLPHNLGIINTSILTMVQLGPEIFCGTDASGIFTTNDGGNTWQPRSTGLPSAPVSSILQSGQFMFCGLKMGGGVFKSTDQGITWSQSGLTGSVYALATLPGRLYTSTNSGLYRSDDNGYSWISSGNGLPAGAIAFSLVPDGNDIYAGLYAGGVYVSTDQGINWTARTIGISGLTVYSLMKKDSILFAGTNTGVYRSMDAGANWTQVNSGLTSIMVNAMTSADNGILAGTFNGLFLSKNNGDTWINVTEGLTDTDINSILVSGNKVFAGTAHNGVWTNQLSVILGDEENNPSRRLQIYPNPANDKINLKSGDPGMLFDKIKIFDILGTLIFSREFELTNYHCIDISSLPRGSYIIVIKIAEMDNKIKLLLR